MKIAICSAVVVALFAACETLTGSNSLNPPRWIQGTWEPCSSDAVHRWEFSADRAVLTTDDSKTDYSKLSGSGVTVRDETDSDRYVIRYANGPARAITVIIFRRDGPNIEEYYYYEWGEVEVEYTLTLCRN